MIMTMTYTVHDTETVAPTAAADLYLDLLKKCLTRSIFRDTFLKVEPAWIRTTLDAEAAQAIEQFLASHEFDVVRRCEVNPDDRRDGRDWPPDAETMVGMRRLDNLQEIVTRVLRDGVPGDLIETGVWRGGCTIFMRAILAAFGDDSRTVWVADSFQGLPPPRPETFPEDADDTLWRESRLAIGLQTVQDNFAKYGLLDDRVRFLPGWFSDTLPEAPIERLAVMRLDGDMYESTITALESLYPRLSAGGFVIIDDYALLPCRKAVHDFRARYGISDELIAIDWTGVYWRRGR
jgi:O-methyltransferase